MMDDTKKLRESELEQVCGGDSDEAGFAKYEVKNQNGTDLCNDPSLRGVPRHLEYKTTVYYLSRSRDVAKVKLRSGIIGYVLFHDIRES